MRRVVAVPDHEVRLLSHHRLHSGVHSPTRKVAPVGTPVPCCVIRLVTRSKLLLTAQGLAAVGETTGCVVEIEVDIGDLGNFERLAFGFGFGCNRRFF